MINYVKCPRCDLNYIDEDKQEYCDVCLAEMRGTKLQFADLDVDEEELDTELEEELTEICPVCGINRMRAGDKMCDMCKRNENYETEEEVDPENDEEWKNYLDEDDDTTDLTVDDEELAEELDGPVEDEESSDDEDDFESEDVDSLSDLEDDEDDDDGYDDSDDDDEF